MPRPLFRLACAFALAAAPSHVVAQAWLLDPSAPTVIDESSALLSAAFTPLPDGRVLAYGRFTHINGTAAPGLTRLGAEGSVDPGFNAETAANGNRWWSVAPLGAGGFIAIIAPDLANVMPASLVALEGPTSVFGIITPPQASVTSAVTRLPSVPIGPASTLFRLHADGRRDPAFAPLACDGLPRLLPLADGRILISGTFTTLGGLPRNGLARLRADGTVDPTFAPKLADTVVAITAAAPAANGAVIASGYTYDANNRPAYSFVRVTANGAIDPGFAPGPVNATFGLLIPQPDGGVLAGNYTVFRYSPTGAIDFRYALKIPQLKSLVRAVPLAEGRMVVEASVGPSNTYGTPAVFTISATGEVETDHRPATGTAPAQRLLAVFPDERLLLLQAGTVVSVLVANNENVVGASVAAQATSAVAAVAATTLDPTAALTAIVPIIEQPTLTGSSLALRHPGTGSLVPFSAAFTQRRTGTIAQLERDASGRVLITGSFTHVEGHARPGLARFHADGSLDLGFAPEPGVTVLHLPPDGRPVVRTSSGRVSRLRVDGSLDAAFTFPSGIDPNKTRWLTGTPDGRLLISAFTPDDTSEANLKLIWLGADGTRLNTLPTRFGGFAQRYLYYVTIPVVTVAPTYGSSPVTTNVDSSTSSAATTGTTVGSTGTTTTTSAAVATIGAALGAATPATSIPPSSTSTLITGPAVPFPSYYPYYIPNTISAARILADNRILVAGGFQTADTLSRPGLVWLRADGTVDGPRPGPATITTPVLVGPSPEPVLVTTVPAFYYPPPSLLLPDGRALVFNTQYIGYSTRVVAKRVRDDGTTDPTFTPAPGSLSTTTRALDDGSLFSGGRLYTADGLLNPHFAPQYVFNGASVSNLTTLAVQIGNHLWIAGRFDQVDGAPRQGLARFRTTEIVGITFGPRSQTVVTGRDATFDVLVGTHQPATYRWTHDGTAIPGTTNATLRLPDSHAAHAGDYRVIVTIAGQEFTSAPATLTLAPNTARLVNFSARSTITPTSPQIAGVVCADVPPRTLLLRAVGRGLFNSGNATLLPTPVLTLYDGPRPLAENRGSATHPAIVELARQVGAFPIVSTAGGAALAREIGAGALTVITTSGDNGSGVSLFECYDTGSALAAPLVRNFSIRGLTAAGNGILTAGIVIGGAGPLRVLIRAVGPTLAGFGVTGAVADPILHVFASAEPTPLATNDNWSGDPGIAAAAAIARAFPLAAASRDAALVLNLEPGAYTAQLVGAGGATGEGLIEIYALDR